jgi:Beta-xylosidase
MQDTSNYLVTAKDIKGSWSEPIALNNFGFDPSLFHDEDNRKYLVSMVTDHRIPQKYRRRLILQEYDFPTKKMVGSIKDIYVADKIYLEGPHIFKRNGWYYLFCADTGTEENHGQTIQRSKCIWGTYTMYKAEFMHRESENEAGRN